MVRELCNDLALIGAGLTGVSADVADSGVVQNALVGLVALVTEGLTVDEDAGDTGVDDLVDRSVSGGGLDQVQDDGIHTLGDEVVDLVVLLSHVVLAVDDGDIILDVVGLEALEVVEHLVAVEGHEVVVELVDRDTDLVGAGCGSNNRSNSLSGGLFSRSSLGCGFLGGSSFLSGSGIGSDLHVVDPVVVLDGLAVESLDGHVDSGVGLAYGVVQDGAGHGAFVDHLNALLECVNTDKVDVLADSAARCGDGGGGTQCHGVVVAEDDLDLIAELGKVVGADLLALRLGPVADLVVEALDLDTGILESLDGELGAVLRVDVLGIALDHDVADLAVAVDIAVVRELCNDLALVGTGLTGVSADIADGGVVQNALVGLVALVAEGLAVDEDAGDAGINDLGDRGIGRGGLHEVQNDSIHTLGDEVIDLIVLLGHVVLAVDDGHIVLDLIAVEALEVVEQLVAVEGHKVVVELVNCDADFIGFGFRGSGSLSRCGGFGGGGSLCCGRGLSRCGSGRRSGALTTGRKAENHGQRKKKRQYLFHFGFLFPVENFEVSKLLYAILLMPPPTVKSFLGLSDWLRALCQIWSFIFVQSAMTAKTRFEISF